MPVCNRLVRIVLTAVALALLPLSGAQAQEVVRQGAPPEVRALVDAVVKALNDSADAWEALAKERFTPALLKQQSAADRRAQHQKVRADLGTVKFERATRMGPDAPLELHLNGATGATATVTLEIDDSTPLKVTSLKIETRAKGDETRPGGFRPPITSAMSADELTNALGGFLSTLTADDTFSGVVLVARNGAPVFHRAYGLADRANRVPNTIRTRFNIGSINKTFTQMAIGMLVAEGKLAPTDTLAKFLPDYPQATSRTATVQQLLTHSAGIADFFGPAFTAAPKDRFRSNADYARHVGSLPPTFAPGERRQYCNGCYILLGAIIERASGMPYEQFVAERIFKVADMASTGYPQVDAIEPDIAIGYTRRSGADGSLRSNVYLHGASGSAAGGGYSTASDLLAFVNATRAGRLPKGEGGMAIAGGAPGTSAVVEAGREWTVIVLTNLDPPTGEQIGVAIMEALSR
ncbi:MAG TPA: serine hydrolase domain-containing protein [Vicinamibacterales bacterium]|nr:serine hydrolase domain-containing protein [Vicinamibacterales bacterium]